MSGLKPWEKVNPLASLRDKAFSGTKTGRDDYAAGLITLAETYAWYLAMNNLIDACETALPLVKALAKHQEHNGELLFDDEPIMHRGDVQKIEAALAKARGEAT